MKFWINKFVIIGGEYYVSLIEQVIYGPYRTHKIHLNDYLHKKFFQSPGSHVEFENWNRKNARSNIVTYPITFNLSNIEIEWVTNVNFPGRLHTIQNQFFNVVFDETCHILPALILFEALCMPSYRIAQYLLSPIGIDGICVTKVTSTYVFLFLKNASLMHYRDNELICLALWASVSDRELKLYEFMQTILSGAPFSVPTLDADISVNLVGNLEYPQTFFATQMGNRRVFKLWPKGIKYIEVAAHGDTRRRILYQNLRTEVLELSDQTFSLQFKPI